MHALNRLALPFLLLTIPQPASPQTPDSGHAWIASALSDSEVVAAIALGRSTKKVFGFRTVTTTGGFLEHLDFNVIAQGPFGRVASAAAEAARKYMPFTPESVTPAMRAPILTIVASPNEPVISRGTVVRSPPPASHLVLQVRPRDSQGELLTVQPVRVETFPVTWRNLVGGELRGQGVTAFFDWHAVPVEDFQIVVIPEGGGKEHRCGVKQKDRDKLR